MSDYPTTYQPDTPDSVITTEQDHPAKVVAIAIGVMSCGYFAPGSVATVRNTDNQALIWWLCALTSWTVVGWVVALILAAQRTEKRHMPVDESWPKRHPSLLVGGIAMAVVFVMWMANVGSSGDGSVEPEPIGGAPALSGQPIQPAAPEPVDATVDAGTIPPGTHVVGTDIEPGTYRTAGPGADSWTGVCYWERLSGLSGQLDDVIANGLPEGPTTVVIEPSDVAFSTNTCATWQLVN